MQESPAERAASPESGVAKAPPGHSSVGLMRVVSWRAIYTNKQTSSLLVFLRLN